MAKSHLQAGDALSAGDRGVARGAQRHGRVRNRDGGPDARGLQPPALSPTRRLVRAQVSCWCSATARCSAWRCIAHAGRRVPILGVNFRVSDLTGGDAAGALLALESALAADVHVEERLMLRATILHPSAPSQSAWRSTTPSSVKARRRGSSTCPSSSGTSSSPMPGRRSHHRDTHGITALQLSAGGRSSSRSVDALVLTPDAPHTLDNRPIRRAPRRRQSGEACHG